MDKDVDRKVHMEDQLEKISRNYTRIKGVNGHAIKDTRSDVVDGIKFKNFYSKLSEGEIGCFLSHFVAIKTSHDRGDDISMICEDDVYFGTISVIPSLTDIVKNAPQDWEILQLYSSRGIKNRDIENLSYVKWKGHAGTVTYLINKRGMSKILDTILKNGDVISYKPLSNTEIDLFFYKLNLPHPFNGVVDQYIYQLATTYTLSPSIFFTDNTTMGSTIHDSHTKDHISKSAEIISFVPIPNKISQNLSKIPRKYKPICEGQILPGIDVIMYINLDHREDRRQRYFENMQKINLFPEDVERVSGVYIPENGALGCLMSHIKALRMAYEKYPGKNVLIAEDDLILFEEPDNIKKRLYDFFVDEDFNKIWDVLMLSSNTKRSNPTHKRGIKRLLDSQTAACYLVNPDYVEKLLNVLQSGLQTYLMDKVWKSEYCNDQSWKVLQNTDSWYGMVPPLFVQGKSYSDIEKKHVDYKV
jgi:glycosyl transferase family 25